MALAKIPRWTPGPSKGPREEAITAGVAQVAPRAPQLQFDSTEGYPGEGPVELVAALEASENSDTSLDWGARGSDTNSLDWDAIASDSDSLDWSCSDTLAPCGSVPERSRTGADSDS